MRQAVHAFLNVVNVIWIDLLKIISEYFLHQYNSFKVVHYAVYCIAVCRPQGSTFNFSFAIHEFAKLDRTLRYVALSWSTDINHYQLKCIYMSDKYNWLEI